MLARGRLSPPFDERRLRQHLTEDEDEHDTAKDEGIGPLEGAGGVPTQIFVPGDCSMIAAAVQCDVDGVPKGGASALAASGTRDQQGRDAVP